MVHPAMSVRGCWTLGGFGSFVTFRFACWESAAIFFYASRYEIKYTALREGNHKLFIKVGFLASKSCKCTNLEVEESVSSDSQGRESESSSKLSCELFKSFSSFLENALACYP